MKSIYESIKAVMLEYEMGNIGQMSPRERAARDAARAANQNKAPTDKKQANQNKAPTNKKQASQAAPNPPATATTPAKDNYFSRVAKAFQGTVDNANVSQASKSGSFATAYSLRNTNNSPKVTTTKPAPAQVPQANVKPAAKPAAKPDASQQARDAAADASNKVNQAAVAKQKGLDQAQAPTMSDRAATDANVAGTSKTAPAPKEVVAFKQNAQQASPLAPKPEKDVDRSPKAAEPAPAPKVDSEAETTAKKITNMGDSSNVDKEATFNRDRLKDSGVSPGGHTVQRTPEAEKYVAKTYTKPEVPQAASKEPDTAVRSSSREPVRTGSGGILRTDTPDEIANRGPFGIPKNRSAKKTNEQLGFSEHLYNTVMEVLQKGSKPRNEKEQKLAAMHGDPDVITHGDILKARGVKMKESMDTPGNGYEHQCAIHVKSESFGEGRTITTQHADPDENGNIAWYDVMFEHGIERYVPTNELEILVSESHMHSMKKKKKK